MLYQILDLLRHYFYEHLTEMQTLLHALGQPTSVPAEEAVTGVGAAMEKG